MNEIIDNGILILTLTYLILGVIYFVLTIGFFMSERMRRSRK